MRITGRLLKTAALQAEWYDFVDDPDATISRLKQHRPRPDLFTFVQQLVSRAPKYQYYFEKEDAAVVPIATYENWWKKQINDKTRNMVRKAGKKGVSIISAPFDDALLSGIKSIYDESPLRQGRRFKHHGKPLEQLRKEHSSYLDRSEFFGAYLGETLIGFVKLVFHGEWASMMNIIAKVAERDKAPTNALIAKAVERCAERGIGYLQYGTWSRRTIGDFKIHHGFERRPVPRYFIPLTSAGKCMLACGLHKNIVDRLPGSVVDRLSYVRTWFYQMRYK